MARTKQTGVRSHQDQREHLASRGPVPHVPPKMATVSTGEELQAWIKGDDPVTRVFPSEKLDDRTIQLVWSDKLTAKRCKVATATTSSVIAISVSPKQWSQSEAVGGAVMGALEATTKPEYERLITLMACYYAIKWRRGAGDDTLAKLGIDSPMIRDKVPVDLEACAATATASPEELHKTLKMLGKNQIVTAEDKATIKTSLQHLFGIPDAWARKLRTHFSKVLKKNCCTYRGLETTLALNQLTAFRGSGKVALFYGRYRARTSAQWAMLCMVWCVAKHMGEATGIDYFDKLQIPINVEKLYTLIEERAPPQDAELKSAVEGLLDARVDLTGITMKNVREALETKFQCDLKEKKPFMKECVADWNEKSEESDKPKPKQPKTGAPPVPVVHAPLALPRWRQTQGTEAGTPTAPPAQQKQQAAPLKRKRDASSEDSSVTSSPPAKKLDMRTKCTNLWQLMKQHAEQAQKYAEQAQKQQKDFESLMRTFKRDSVEGF